MHLNRRAEEGGFTLTELLVTIVIMSLIVFPLGNAVIGFIRLTDDTTMRLNESHDEQIVAAYFPSDVQALGRRDWTAYPYPLQQSVELDAPATGGLYPCGTAATPIAVVRLAWDDPASVAAAPQAVRVAYYMSTVGSEQQLHRIACVGSATPTSDIVVAHNVASGPSATCATDCLAAPAVPMSVTLTLTVKDPGNTGPALLIVLTGQRRQT